MEGGIWEEEDNDSNVCIVKYIDTLGCTSFHHAPITHSSFHQLISEIQANCPRGFSCTHPVAVFRDMLRWVQVGEDVVLDPEMDERVYSAARWGKSTDKEPKVVTLYVEIEKKKIDKK